MTGVLGEEFPKINQGADMVEKLTGRKGLYWQVISVDVLTQPRLQHPDRCCWTMTNHHRSPPLRADAGKAIVTAG